MLRSYWCRMSCCCYFFLFKVCYVIFFYSFDSSNLLDSRISSFWIVLFAGLMLIAPGQDLHSTRTLWCPTSLSMVQRTKLRSLFPTWRLVKRLEPLPCLSPGQEGNYFFNQESKRARNINGGIMEETDMETVSRGKNEASQWLEVVGGAGFGWVYLVRWGSTLVF